MEQKLALALFLAGIVFFAGCAQQNQILDDSGDDGSDDDGEPTNPQEPTLIVGDQEYQNNEVLIDLAFLDKPGFVVIHLENPDRSPGTVIGNSSVFEGTLSPIIVQLAGDFSEGQPGTKVIAMLHYDNGNRAYTSLDEDLATKVNNQIVMQSFTVTKIRIEEKGTLEVTVTNPNGIAVEGAVVEVFVENKKIATGNTNAEGIALIELLPLDKEWYVSVADAQNQFQAISAEIEEPVQANSLKLQLQKREEPEPPGDQDTNAINLSLESDDQGFYLDGQKISTFSVASGSIVNLTIIQRTANSAFGGADIKSTAFSKFNVPNGQNRTILFTVLENVKIESFWPGSSVKKSQVTFTVE